MRSMPPASRSTSAACPAKPVSTSSGCPGSRAVARRLSGACGTTPSTWPTISPPSVSTSSIASRPRSFARSLSAPDHFSRSFLMPTHTRIRMFNTQQTYPNQSLDNDLCQAVRAGNTVYVRGQVGSDFDGNLVGLGDPRAQAEQAMRNVKQLLEEAGSDLSHIVKTTTYLIDPRYREPVYQEVGKWLEGVFPISTGLVISGLGQPEWLMEIDVIAVVPDDWTV